MKFLFIHGSLELGGVETLILRKSKWLKSHGHSVTVYVAKGGSLATEVSKYADVYILGHLNFLLLGITSFSGLNQREFDVIHVFNTESLWSGISFVDNNLTKLVTGVYHPREYTFLNNSPYFLKAQVKLFQEVSENNILFMNEAVKNSHGKFHNRAFENSKVLPLPVILQMDEHFLSGKVVTRDPIKIKSIGRITNFKTYNFYMIDIIKNLNEAGINSQYHIYGDGDEKHNLEKYIKEKGMEKFVVLHGLLPYDKFAEALTDAFMFIGMGTSVIEAATLGIPSLVAIDSDTKAETFGFLHEIDGYSVGEIIDQPRTKVIDKIVNLYNLDQNSYQTVSEKEINNSKKFELEYVMSKYMAFVESLKPVKVKRGLISRTLVLASKLIYYFIQRPLGLDSSFKNRYL